MLSDQRLYTLDGLRGIAAITVVLFHMSSTNWIMQSGYLAVDFFFMLSGLVISNAYGSRLRDGMSLKSFVLTRAIRLYPMYIIGVFLSASAAVAMVFTGSVGALTIREIGLVLATEVFLLPSPVRWAHLYPLNGPSWSLFYEFVANFLFAWAFVKLSTRVLFGVLGVAMVGLVATCIVSGNLNGGDNWSEIDLGLARVTYSFVAGVILQRLGIAAPKLFGTRAFFLAPLLFIFLLLPVWLPKKDILDLSYVFLMCPILVCLGARWQPPVYAKKICELLGDLSYPLYAVHWPCIYVAAVVARWLSIPSLVWIPAFLTALIVAAIILGRVVDLEIRKALTKIFATSNSARSHPVPLSS